MPHRFSNPDLSSQPLLSIGIALGSGALMALSTAPLNAFPLAWVALVPLWMMVGSEHATLKPPTSKRVFLLALAWGIGYHGLALAWIRDLHPLTWLGIPWLGSVAIVLFAWSFIALWGAALVAIWAIGLSWVIRRNDRSSWLTSSWHHVLVGTALWCGLEWLWSLGSLYWTSLSYTQSPGNLAILHLGQLSGPTTVTAAIVAVNGLIAEGWMRYQGSEVRGQSNKAFYKLLSSAVVVIAVLHLVGYGLYSRPVAQFPEAALRVGIIQGNVPTRIKHTAEGRQRAVDGYVTGYERLADEGADAVLTPEGAFPFRWDDRDKAENSFYQAVRRKGRVGWLGTFVVQGDRLTQSLLTLTGDGQTLSRYNKLKIVPLGEYIPLRSILGVVINRLSPVQTDLLPGATNQTFETPFGRAIASICYDSAFPEVFRRQAATGGQFILTASNLDPYSEVLMAQHQAQDIMRAIETDRWAARATNTGYSGILDPHGRVQWRSQPRTYQLHTDTIYRRQTQTLYVRWGDWLTPLLGVAALGVVLQRQFLQSTTTP